MESRVDMDMELVDLSDIWPRERLTCVYTGNDSSQYYNNVIEIINIQTFFSYNRQLSV